MLLFQVFHKFKRHLLLHNLPGHSLRPSSYQRTRTVRPASDGCQRPRAELRCFRESNCLQRGRPGTGFPQPARRGLLQQITSPHGAVHTHHAHTPARRRSEATAQGQTDRAAPGLRGPTFCPTSSWRSRLGSTVTLHQRAVVSHNRSPHRQAPGERLRDSEAGRN